MAADLLETTHGPYVISSDPARLDVPHGLYAKFGYEPLDDPAKWMARTRLT